MAPEKFTTLAISMQRQKGVYALLIGSGVSQTSSIPTGWSILTRLIQKVALVQDETISGDPIVWYQERFKREPTYGELLELAADTAAERAAIIQEYIEPNEDERELGLKQPAEAHRAIAQLVSSGYVRVIVTTNFDRLIEIALAEAGITPSVISSEDGINGSRPLAHNSCTIIKIHGDYADARIRNTATELSGYDDGMQRLLRQVFREYGLVVSGWSAQWDTALVALLREERSPWFSTFWVAYSEPKEAAREVIEARTASVLTHMSAEEFFSKLSESVSALDNYENAELLSLTMAEESLKRYLDDPTKRIRIHDLVVGEASRVSELIWSSDLGAEITQESVEQRLEQYESASETLRTLFVTGCYWGKDEHISNWIQALERLINFQEANGQQYVDWAKLRLYPALQLLYSGGIAAVANNQYRTLGKLLYDPILREPRGRYPEPILNRVHNAILTQALGSRIAPSTPSQFVLPWRMRQAEWFWATLRKYIPQENRRIDLFLEFEYLFGLIHTDIQLQSAYPHMWGPSGSIRELYDDDRIDPIRQRMESMGESWGPLQAGLFGGSLERLSKAREQFELILSRR